MRTESYQQPAATTAEKVAALAFTFFCGEHLAIKTEVPAMSGKLMGEVYELKLPRVQRDVLQAICDHAKDDGMGAFPSVALLAWKCDLSERQTKRGLKQLEDVKLIERVAYAKGGRGCATHYRVNLSAGTQKPPFQPRTKGVIQMSPFRASNGDTQMSPFSEGGDENGDISSPKRVTSQTQKGDTQMSPQPSLTTVRKNRPSPLTPLQAPSDALTREGGGGEKFVEQNNSSKQQSDSLADLSAKAPTARKRTTQAAGGANSAYTEAELDEYFNAQACCLRLPDEWLSSARAGKQDRRIASWHARGKPPCRRHAAYDFDDDEVLAGFSEAAVFEDDREPYERASVEDTRAGGGFSTIGHVIAEVRPARPRGGWADGEDLLFKISQLDQDGGEGD